MLKKFHCLLSFILMAVCAMAQPLAVTQAIITTKTTIIVPEGAEADGPQATIIQQGGAEGGQMVRRFGGAGESESKTYLKGNLVKTVVENEMGRTSTIRDNAAKKTTTLMEIMGNKRGFYSTDEEQAEMRKRMDSMMQSRSQDDPTRNTTPPTLELQERTDTKTIAGYACKKAVVRITRSNGSTDSAVVWYAPELHFDGLPFTGNSGGGFAGMTIGRNTNAEILAKVPGFPLSYEINMRRGRKMVVEITKIDTQKDIKDKEFEISKDFDLKPMKEMQGNDGRIQMRIGG